MAIAEDGGFGTLLAPLGDQHRAAAHRVFDDLAVKAETVQGGCDLVGEIGAQYRKALLDLAFGRDRDAAGEVGGETALVEIRFGGGDRGGAGHAGLRKDKLRAIDLTILARQGVTRNSLSALQGGEGGARRVSDGRVRWACGPRP